jgi:hypothetical protein
VNLITGWPRLMRPDIAAEYVGGQTLFDMLLEAGLKPLIRRKNLTVYDKLEVDAAVSRMDGEET